IHGPPLFNRTASPVWNRSMRRAPAVERRSPAPSRHGHHTLGHRVLPAFPVQEAFASSVPSLGPACGPAAMVGGSTPCTAGDALGAGRLAGRHRQRVTTGAHRCQPVSTADGARVWGKETYTIEVIAIYGILGLPS